MERKRGINFFLILTIFFSCFWASDILSIHYGIDVSDTVYMMSRITMTVCFGISSIVFYLSKPSVTWLVRYSVINLIFYILFTVIAFMLGDSQNSASILIGIIASIFEGMLTSCVLLLLAWLICPGPLTYARITIPVAFAVAHALALIIGLLPTNILIWFEIILSSGSAIGFCILAHHDTVGEIEPLVTQQAISKSQTKSLCISLSNSMSWSLLLGIIVFPFLYGLMSQIYTLSGNNYDFYNVSTELVVIALLTLLALIAFILKDRFDTNALFLIVFFIFATAFLFIPFSWDREFLISGYFLRSGLFIFFTLLWISLCSAFMSNRYSMLFSFSVSLGLYYLMSIISRLIANWLYDHVSFSLSTISTIALILVWVLSMAALIIVLITNRRNKVTKIQGSSFDDRLAALAIKYSLSDRELAVCREYAWGRTVESIATQLTISPETVRTHIKRMYTKTSCHSREDLIDLIDNMQQIGDNVSEQ